MKTQLQRGLRLPQPAAPYYITGITSTSTNIALRPTSIQGAEAVVCVYCGSRQLLNMAGGGRCQAGSCPNTVLSREHSQNRGIMEKSANSSLFCYQGGKAHTEETKNPFMCAYQFNLPKQWKHRGRSGLIAALCAIAYFQMCLLLHLRVDEWTRRAKRIKKSNGQLVRQKIRCVITGDSSTFKRNDLIHF